MPEGEATEATIHLIYKAYYEEMGGAGAPPEFRARSSDPVTDNVTAFKRPPVPRKPAQQKPRGGSDSKAPASRRPDLRLPGRGLCRDPVFPAVM